MARALDLFNSVLPNLDAGNFEFYNSLTDQQKKEFSPFVIMKFMSAVRNKKDIPYHLIAVNRAVNRDFWELSDYPDLQYLLLAACGSGSKKRHYFPGKQLSDTPIFKFLKDCYPFMKADEVQMFLDINGPDDIIQLAKDFGMQDSELKKFMKDVKKHYEL